MFLIPFSFHLSYAPSRSFLPPFSDPFLLSLHELNSVQKKCGLSFTGRRHASCAGMFPFLPVVGSCPVLEDAGRWPLCRGPGVLFLAKISPVIIIIIL